MKKQNLKSLKLNKIEVSNLKSNTLAGGLTGKSCWRTWDYCTDECPSDDGPSNDVSVKCSLIC